MTGLRRLAVCTVVACVVGLAVSLTDPFLVALCVFVPLFALLEVVAWLRVDRWRRP